MIETKFKQTEIGLIPEDWEVKTLGELSYVTSGGTPSTENSSYWGGDIPWMNSGELNLKQVNAVEGRITELGLKQSSTRMLPPYCVLIGLAGQGKTRGTAAYNTIPLCINQSIGAVLPNNSYNTMYMYYYIDSQYQNLRTLSSGDGGRGGLTKQLLSDFSVPLPPLDEQEKIATALSDVDALINELGELITKKRDIKQGTMQQLLAGKKRLPGFTDEWKEQTLNDICSLSKGIQLNSSKMNDSGLYPVFNGGIAPSGYFSECNTEANTIIISEGGNSCGFVNYIKEPFWRGGHCYSLSNISIDKVFLYHILKFNETSIMALRTGSGLPNIKKSTLANFCLKNPQSISEQQAIATILTDMDDEIQALEAKRDKYIAIKQGMMQELLTGKIRLV